jgi:hypothetical protein
MGMSSMSGEYVVLRSELIRTAEEARAYYATKLAGVHPVNCHGKQISLYFPQGYTHVYSVAVDKSKVDSTILLQRRLQGGGVEVRAFSVDRARLMDQIIPSVQGFTVSLPERDHTSRRRLYGQRLRDNRYLCVVLRPGNTKGNWECVTAFPVGSDDWLAARRARTAKFPP